MTNQDLLASADPRGYVFASDMRYESERSAVVVGLQDEVRKLQTKLDDLQKERQETDAKLGKVEGQVTEATKHSDAVRSAANKVLQKVVKQTADDEFMDIDPPHLLFNDYDALEKLATQLKTKQYTDTFTTKAFLAQKDNDADAEKFLRDAPRLAVSRVVDKTSRPIRLEIYFPAPETTERQKQIHDYLRRVGKSVPNIRYILVPESLCGKSCSAMKPNDDKYMQILVDLTFAILPTEDEYMADFEIDEDKKLSEEEKDFLHGLCNEIKMVSYTLEDLTELRDENASSFLHSDDLRRFLKFIN
jgi:hypothetical protein